MSFYSKEKISRKSLKRTFSEKVFQQIGALCFRKRGHKISILLISSRRSGRWIIPKGWKLDKFNNRKSAALEAWEEAGVQGRVSNRSVGVYFYRKKKTEDTYFTCQVKVFSLQVMKMKKNFPEKNQRKQIWVTPAEAIPLLMEPELKELIKKFHSKSKEI